MMFQPHFLQDYLLLRLIPAFLFMIITSINFLLFKVGFRCSITVLQTIFSPFVIYFYGLKVGFLFLRVCNLPKITLLGELTLNPNA